LTRNISHQSHQQVTDEHIPPESSVTPPEPRSRDSWFRRRARGALVGYVMTCRSHQSRPVLGNLRWGGPYLSNTVNSRAVFSPSEILRGLLGARENGPPCTPPAPPRLVSGPAPRMRAPLVPSCGPSETGRAHKPGRTPSRGAIPVLMRAAARGGQPEHFVPFRSRLAIYHEA